MRGNVAGLHAQRHITAWDEHVPETERYNRTLKECVGRNYNIIPFEHLPLVVVIEMVYTAIFWRNIVALKGSVSKTQSPSEIILNHKLNFNAHCKVDFGKYVQTHEEHDNTTQLYTIGAIATRLKNAKGGYYFTSLSI